MKNIFNLKKEEKTEAVKVRKTKIDYFIDALANLLYAISAYFILKKVFSIDILDFSSENFNKIKSILLPVPEADKKSEVFFIYVLLIFLISKIIFDSIVGNILSLILKRENYNIYNENKRK